MRVNAKYTDNRTRNFNMRMSSEEYKEFTALADRLELTKSAMFRYAIKKLRDDLDGKESL